MNLIRNKPVSAFCILCHDADAVLPFYLEVLGFNIQRAEESFYSFVRRGTATTLCLWEIGHISKHTSYERYDAAVIPRKIVLSLTFATRAEVDRLHFRLKGAGTRTLSDPGSDEIYGFHFVDPCAIIWEVQALDAPKQDADLALNRITLICQDLESTKAFYENTMSLPSTPIMASRVTYPAINNSAISLWDARDATASLNLFDFSAQKHSWSANTAMLAHSFESLLQLRTAHKSLLEKGVLFDHTPAYFDWDFNACYFRDPENNIWEFFEMPSNIKQRQLPEEE